MKCRGVLPSSFRWGRRGGSRAQKRASVSSEDVVEEGSDCVGRADRVGRAEVAVPREGSGGREGGEHDGRKECTWEAFLLGLVGSVQAQDRGVGVCAEETANR